MSLLRSTPILRIFDEALARAFYLDFLGFQVDFEHRFEAGAPVYLAVSRDGLALHLSAHYGDASPGASVRFETTDVDALCAELRAQDNPHARPRVEDTPWGTRDFTVWDPFGNRLTFSNVVDD
jgi:uncharacterized glyoxalase superfamily protein PhnB